MRENFAGRSLALAPGILARSPESRCARAGGPAEPGRSRSAKGGNVRLLMVGMRGPSHDFATIFGPLIRGFLANTPTSAGLRLETASGPCIFEASPAGGGNH